MTDSELADKLREIYLKAPVGQKTLAVHLFGIIYANELEHHDLEEIREMSGLSRVESTIREGMDLSRMVKLDTAGLVLVDELGIAEGSWDSAPPL